MAPTSIAVVRSCCGTFEPGHTAQAAPSTPPLPPIEGRFDLIDHLGRAVHERSYGDRYLLIFFGFTHCAAICPRELGKLGTALGRLGPLAGRIQPLYLTVDPLRDDPPTMRLCVERHPGGFTGLTGTPERVTAAMKSFRVFARRVDDPDAPGGYRMPHTAYAYLMAPGGRCLAHLPDSLDVAAVVERLRQLVV